MTRSRKSRSSLSARKSLSKERPKILVQSANDDGSNIHSDKTTSHLHTRLRDLLHLTWTDRLFVGLSLTSFLLSITLYGMQYRVLGDTDGLEFINTIFSGAATITGILTIFQSKARVALWQAANRQLRSGSQVDVKAQARTAQDLESLQILALQHTEQLKQLGHEGQRLLRLVSKNERHLKVIGSLRCGLERNQDGSKQREQRSAEPKMHSKDPEATDGPQEVEAKSGRKSHDCFLGPCSNPFCCSTPNLSMPEGSPIAEIEI